MALRRRINLCLIVIFSLAFAVQASSRNRQNVAPDPVKWSLQFQPRQKFYRKRAPFKVQIIARIQPGWHLYALDEIPNGPRPTRITLPAEQPFELAGEIEQPEPIIKFDKNFGVETQFYQVSATFLAPLKISATARAGATKLVVQARYQTCNEHLCLPPKTVRLEALITIK